MDSNKILSHISCQAITWTNDDYLSIGALGIAFIVILIKVC